MAKPCTLHPIAQRVQLFELQTANVRGQGARPLGAAANFDPHDFVIELTRLMEACHVADLAMSEWGITVEELPAIAHNALTTNGVLFSHDPVTLTDPDVVKILKNSYR